ncbi:MAG: 23S rRNA (guanosine(2251)-2'-O)-methyltransferase RlmB [Mariprofundaceae bacterium]|nr:23S rRNA (guanosine(2251)-2'-O)-methyltransferase RlmB [Mariprofundaceae bacterium]
MSEENHCTVGIHAVRHLLQSEHQQVSELLIEKGKSHPRINELIHLAKKQKIPVHIVPKEALTRLADAANHQGALAKTVASGSSKQPSFKEWLDCLTETDLPIVLLLDQVTDPHNFGACLRSAEAAGCAAVIIPRHHAADLNSPIATKTACGAAARLPVFQESNLCRALERLQDHGFWSFGLAGEGEESLYDVAFTGRCAIVMGSEDTGLRPLVRKHCDRLIRIPMPGTVESLNVSVATGVTLFEAVRQRRLG